MKILVFSDSHRSMSGMYSAIDRHLPDQVIHLGDLLQDAEMLADIYPRLPICRVPGNCDGWTTEPLKRQITLAGKQFLLSHGHLWGVKVDIATQFPTPKQLKSMCFFLGIPTAPCAISWRTGFGS